MKIKELVGIIVIASHVRLLNIFAYLIVNSIVSIIPKSYFYDDPSALSMDLLNNETTIDEMPVPMKEFEFHRLKEIAQFIKTLEKESTLPENLVSNIILDTDPLYTNNAYAAKYKGRYCLGLSEVFRQTDKYSMEELKALIAHELGHMINEKDGFFYDLVRVIHYSSQFSIFTALSIIARIVELWAASESQNMEKTADKIALELYCHPEHHISLHEKLSESLEQPIIKEDSWDFDDYLTEYVDSFNHFIRSLYPVPEVYTNTHPPSSERITFFKSHLPVTTLETPKECSKQSFYGYP